MAGFVTGSVPIGKDATLVASVPPSGLMVQNTGDGPVTIGGPDVEWEKGIMLPPGMVEPLRVPGGAPSDGGSGAVVVGAEPPGSGDPLALYACSLTGNGRIAYLLPG